MNLRRILLTTAAAVVAAATAVFAAGELLSVPAHRALPSPPPELAAVAVTLPVSPNEQIKGWFARGGRGKGAVLLLHGVRGDRTKMLPRALKLKSQGYSVLLVDLPAHGESSGNRITFGFREADGVKAALMFLRETLPTERIGVIGVSLGAASLVISKVEPAPNAVVLESMYPTITEAVQNRLIARIGRLGVPMSKLLLWQLPIRAGITPDQLRPIDALKFLKSPTFIASGVEDLHTTIAETQRIFAEAPTPKEFWAVEGAAHVDLYGYDPRTYEQKVFPFLARHLHSEM